MSILILLFLVAGLASLFFFVFRPLLQARKKKVVPDDLNKAYEQGWITEEELLRLRCERAEETLKTHLLGKKKK